MNVRVARIRRHPIKSVGGEDMAQVTLTPGHPIPGDRAYAILTQAAERHAIRGIQQERWLPKSSFLRGVASPGLQAVSGGWGAEGNDDTVQLSHPDLGTERFDLGTQQDELLAWLGPLWPADKSPAARLVRAPVTFSDVKHPWVSILSLDSLRALEGELGLSLGIERWRANIWLEGAAPYAERDLVGKEVALGQTRLRVIEPIGRCDATSANTQTGTLDCDMPQALRDAFGHNQFGVYAEVISGGVLTLKDELSI